MIQLSLRALVCLWTCQAVLGFVQQHPSFVGRGPVTFAFTNEAPSDYDSDADFSTKKQVTVDENEDDAVIRDGLKREILMLGSTTNRGQHASVDERNTAIDLVAQLEALNPTAEPASNCEGDWDLCFASTQLFRSSPFFQSIRVAVGDENKAIAMNGFSIHDRATSASRIGRVRQTITTDKLISEVELQVGVIPGFPIRLQGTVITTSSVEVVGDAKWEVEVLSTQVKGSNVPIINQYLDDLDLEVPVTSVYNALQGKVPVVPMKTFYVDQEIRITRDVDDNFFVFSRA